MTVRATLTAILGACASCAALLPLVAANDTKPRLLVLTDIGGDPDDQQSMVRLMVYSNEFEIEGLIASASGTPGELNQAVTKPQLIHEIVDAYGQVRDNLALHTDGYPTAEHLPARIKSGNPQRGLDAIGQHDWVIPQCPSPVDEDWVLCLEKRQ